MLQDQEDDLNSETESHRCPVCNFNMPYLYEIDVICPCCGTQFGYDDSAKTVSGRHERCDELRIQWMEAGQPFRHPRLRPIGWNPAHQAGDLLTVVEVMRPPFEGRRLLVLPTTFERLQPEMSPWPALS